MFIVQRDTDRTESDDFTLNVQPKMGEEDGATLVTTENDVSVWIIKPLYE